MDVALRSTALWVLLLILAFTIPAGTILPVRLDFTLSSTKCKPGEIISARVMQDVPLPNGGAIRAGAKVIGRIVNVTAASDGHPASLSLRFDTLETSEGKLSVTTDLRAIASFTEVERAQVPLGGADRGTPANAWTTVQIGGDVVYRGGGYVVAHGERVGKPVNGGVLGPLRSNPERGCTVTSDVGEALQALWLFSSDACGTYDLTNLRIRRAGPANPSGEIILDAAKGQVRVRAGAGLLLSMNDSAPAN
ncbi:MAG TPA: hypothetical protein VEJ45_06600 [Candidatus Acidoferrales bacterium]|nr:hypothetical protein [Candidatus Acidoferrales bacterium]